ncbi:hypothetical protein NA57DRAFT_34709 [Rhizodiscina lignyota]|uniref:DUF7708 domain-containing protein n=1 Tax=Rhizodiscina lignyota TaxID=1504668 RepID=A0A9P4IL30_9PEZI|nr:hypothetical protein NA57DRAFT_34709 [Rhizodiscina lignyota]
MENNGVANVLVRRFTDEMTSETRLESRTRIAQQTLDIETEEAGRRRFNYLYETVGESVPPFQEAKNAQAALIQQWEAAIQSLPQGKARDSVFRIRRRTQMRQKQTKEELSKIAIEDIHDVEEAVQDLGKTLDAKQSKISRHFHAICGTLENHSEIFSIFPTEDRYFSVFCGVVTVLVHASTTHSKLGETLASSVEQVTKEAARCVQLIDLFNTKVMQRHLADIYEAIFQLFTEAIKWYTSSSTSRFRASFSDALPKRVDGTVANIRRHISEMHRDRELASAAELRDTRLGVEEVNDKLNELHAELAAESRNSAFFNQGVGLLAVRLLHSIIQSQSMPDNAVRMPEQFSRSIELLEDAPPRHSREIALRHVREFKDKLIGNSGLALLSDQQRWFAEPEAIESLSEWLGSTATSSTLWVTGQPEMHSTDNCSKTIAFGALAAALGAKAPFISHFCELPDVDQITKGASAEELGLLGLLYSLIIQLLDFKDMDGDVDLSLERLEQLDGTTKSCNAALELLEDLLAHTQHIPYCIIDNLAELDYGRDTRICSNLLDILLSRQRDDKPVFNLLLTTNGQSETLCDKIPIESTIFLKYNSRRVKHAGQLLELRIPQHFKSTKSTEDSGT